MLIVGIDEAGYGPLLGPLVVSGVAFSIPDDPAGADLWRTLRNSVCKSPSQHDHRLPIADSKKLYKRKTGLAALERPALVMLRAAGRAPGTLRSLLDLLAPSAAADLAIYPWYERYDTPLPFCTTPADVTTRANAVRRDMSAGGVTLTAVFAELLAEGHFNRMVTQTHNKAVVLMTLALRVARRLLPGSGDRIHIYVDRHGGRLHYVEALRTFFQDCRLRVLEESDRRSAYQLDGGHGPFAIEFVTNGEDAHLPVALASVYSKYLRELLMEALNAYFARRVEGLNPTAGYYRDAKRFLVDIQAAVMAEQLDPSMLVRQR